ncbi:MAG: SRPBCC family protein [Cyanobacteria bacterium P01_A01_bin.45]
MQIKQQVTINTSADLIWEILGPRYDRVAEWASSVHTSEKRNNDVIPQNAPCSGRVCETDLGSFKENITRYDESKKIISYNAQGEKMPFFVKQLANTWTVTPITNNQAKVDMCMEISIMPVFNLVMGPMMRMQMSGVAKKAIEELKYFVENSAPHPRKLEAQQTNQLNSALY